MIAIMIASALLALLADLKNEPIGVICGAAAFSLSSFFWVTA